MKEFQIFAWYFCLGFFPYELPVFVNIFPFISKGILVVMVVVVNLQLGAY